MSSAASPIVLPGTAAVSCTTRRSRVLTVCFKLADTENQPSPCLLGGRPRCRMPYNSLSGLIIVGSLTLSQCVGIEPLEFWPVE